MKLLWVSGKLSSTRFIFERKSRLETDSQGLASATVIAKVNGELWDLDRPFEKDSTLQLIKFDDEQGNSSHDQSIRFFMMEFSFVGKQVFWHSTAHIMGEAMELNYGGCLCYGPPIEQGFYYDMYLENR